MRNVWLASFFELFENFGDVFGLCVELGSGLIVFLGFLFLEVDGLVVVDWHCLVLDLSGLVSISANDMLRKSVISNRSTISAILLRILKMASVGVSLMGYTFRVPCNLLLLHKGPYEFTLLVPARFDNSALFH